MDNRLIESLHALDSGELWSFLRAVLDQGRSIEMDNVAGRYPTYEHLSARMDEAARERADELLAVLRQMDNPWNDPILGGSRMDREQPSNGETEAQRALRLSRKYVFVTYANLARLDHNNQEEAQLLRIIDKGIAALSNPSGEPTSCARTSQTRNRGS